MPRRRALLPHSAVASTALLASLLATLLLAGVLSACGGGSEGEHPAGHPASTSGSGSAGEAPEEAPEEGDGTRIAIERVGDSVTPSGERVEVPVGEPITLVVTADAPGELHVHSTPEQEIAYQPGTSEHRVTIDRPGVVEVESHDPHLVVLQLEAR